MRNLAEIARIVTEQERYRRSRGLPRWFSHDVKSAHSRWFYGILGRAHMPMSSLTSSLTLDQINHLVEWKLYKYGDRKEHAQKEPSVMQEQITIELRVDFDDPQKIEEVIKLACHMRNTLVSNVHLLGPRTSPECIVYSDNFMSPAVKVDHFKDLIGEGEKEMLEALNQMKGE